MKMDQSVFDPIEANAAKRSAAFADALSRHIYDCRVKYAMNGDIQELVPMIRENAPLFAGGGQIVREISQAHEVWLFGTGDYGKMIAQLWPMQLCGFLDNAPDKQGQDLFGHPVCAPEEICHHPDALVVITARQYHVAMKEQLHSLGIAEGRILDVGGWVEEAIYPSIYFDLPALKQSEEEVFLDVGSYDGETAELFTDWAGGNVKQIYCFEPDPANQKKIEARLSAHDDVTIIPKGAWNAATELHFCADGKKQSYVSQEGETVIQVDTIDHVLAGERPTFIKMDIEGSELAALRGAEQSIRKYRPKLAISIYHRPEDIFTLPDFILSCHPDYQLYLRHYSLGFFDTVLYAV